MLLFRRPRSNAYTYIVNSKILCERPIVPLTSSTRLVSLTFSWKHLILKTSRGSRSYLFLNHRWTVCNYRFVSVLKQTHWAISFEYTIFIQVGAVPKFGILFYSWISYMKSHTQCVNIHISIQNVFWDDIFYHDNTLFFPAHIFLPLVPCTK